MFDPLSLPFFLGIVGGFISLRYLISKCDKNIIENQNQNQDSHVLVCNQEIPPKYEEEQLPPSYEE